MMASVASVRLWLMATATTTPPSGGYTLVELLTALAMLVGLICGLLTLVDRCAKREHSLSLELRYPLDAHRLLSFLHDNDGRVVRLCLDIDTARWLVDVHPFSHYDLLFLWSRRAWRPEKDMGRKDPVAVVWLDHAKDGDAFIGTGATGAGSFTWRGRFVVRDRGPGGSVFRSSVHSYGLRKAPRR